MRGKEKRMLIRHYLEQGAVAGRWPAGSGSVVTRCTCGDKEVAVHHRSLEALFRGRISWSLGPSLAPRYSG
jgi:hypothetical protein